MGKYKYLFKNIGIMTISNFGTKILSFLMVPLYTNLLSTSEYGTYDLYQTTLFLFVPILSLNIADAIMRFSMDKNQKLEEIIGIAFRIFLKATAVCIVLTVINYKLNIFKVFNSYIHFFCIYFAVSLLFDILSQFARGTEKILDVGIAGIISSVTMLVSNILFLVYFHMGLTGYFLANCLAYILSDAYLFIRLKIWKYIKTQNINKGTQKEMVKYSVPMGLGNIGWWINNVSDRYIVTWICGVGVNGIYSVAYKIPSLLSMFQQIFNQAWTISAVKEYDSNKNEFYSNVYNCYNIGMILTCSVLILFDKVIAKILFGKGFYLAWQYAPFLMISVVFGALVQLLGGIFAATKESVVFGKTIMIGAVINTILNVVLVYCMGAIGAAVATSVSYMIIWAIRLREIYKRMKLNINLKKDIFAYIILYVQAIGLIISNSFLKESILIQIVSLLILILIYFRTIKKYVMRILKR